MENHPLRGKMMALLEKWFASSVLSLPQLFALIFPLFLDQLFLRIILILNTSMIASYGAEAVSAVSMVDSLNNFMVNFFIAVSTGCTVVVAQYSGRRDHKNASLTAAQSLTASVALALVICGLILVFIRPIVSVLFGKGDPLFLEYCTVFLRASAISYPFFALVQTGLGAMRGAGRTRPSLYFSTGINLLNVLFNILFLKIFHWGIEGLSLSIILSRALTAVVILVYMLRSNGAYPMRAADFFKPIMPIQRSVFTVAIPNGLEQIFFHGGRTLTQIFIVGFGTMSTAANAVVFPFSSFVQLFGATMQMALVTIAGQCIGAGQVDEARRYINRITAAAVVGTGVLSLAFGATLPLYLRLYNLPPEAEHYARVVCIMVLIATPLVWSPSFVPPSGLRAAGDGTFTSLSAMLCMWVVRVVLGYVLGVTLGYGLIGIWIAMFTEWAVRSVCYLWRVRGDKWHRHKVIQD